MSAIDEPRLTTGELAERWRVTPATLRAWRYRRVGPAYFKLGGPRSRCLYKLSVIQAYEAANEIKPA